MPIELRWAVPPDTTTNRPILQWREIDIRGGCIIRDWTTVPVVVADSDDDAHPPAPEGGKEN